MIPHIDKYFTLYNEHVKGDLSLLIPSGVVEKAEEHMYDVDLDLTVSCDLSLVNEHESEHVNVLLVTGAFAPIHEGHIEMMLSAAEEVQRVTQTPVAACYVSIDHGSYVGRKTDMFTTMERVQEVERAIAPYPLLQMDYWSCLYADDEVNFTTAYERFSRYIERNSSKKVTLWYVCGGDRFMFMNAFAQYGHGVCVTRGGYDFPDMSLIMDEAKERCIVVNKSTQAMSSTEVRKRLSEEVPFDRSIPRKGDGEMFLIREDGISSPEEHDQLCKIIQSALPIGVKTHMHNYQAKIDSDKKYIILDPLTPPRTQDHLLHISRLFRTDGQYGYLHHTHRVEHDTLTEQIAMIPHGEYVLLDDDVSTGGTMKAAASILSHHGVKVSGFEAFIDVENVYDIVDAKDFILGREYGGLLVKVNGVITRLPYMFPYVNLASRARLEPSSILEASRSLWSLNAKMTKGSLMSVGDLSQEFHQKFEIFGFDSNMSAEDLCAWHIDLIDHVIAVTGNVRR